MHERDVHLGKRLRRRRRLLGLTQQALALAVGVRFQQIQKYECAQNRMSAARLWVLAEALSVPVSYFFEGYSTKSDATIAPFPSEAMNHPETLELVLVYYRLSEVQRVKLLSLVKSMKDEEPGVGRVPTQIAA